MITWVTAESERHFTHDDLTLAEELAKRAAVSLDNADLHSQTLAAAVQLQRAVLPEALPSLRGWELGHHYSPAGRTEVGGDFYDVIELDDGRMVLFIGDVMGRGVGAAAAMAQVRAAVRAYAALDPSPEVVMTRLDQMYDHYRSSSSSRSSSCSPTRTGTSSPSATPATRRRSCSRATARPSSSTLPTVRPWASVARSAAETIVHLVPRAPSWPSPTA